MIQDWPPRKVMPQFDASGTALMVVRVVLAAGVACLVLLGLSKIV